MPREHTHPARPKRVRVALTPSSPCRACARAAAQVRVRVFDKDLTDADDPLGEAHVTLDKEKGSFDHLEMKGMGGFADFSISFSYEVSTYISPAATLTLSTISAKKVPKADKSGKSKRARASDPYFVFKLLEVGDLIESAQTPVIDNSEEPDWGPLSITLELPRGSSRPPLIMCRVWDENIYDEDQAFASNDIRLLAGGGEHEVSLMGRKGICGGVDVSFHASIVEDGDDKAEERKMR